MVGFESSSYTVSEASPEVEVCVQVSGAPFATTELGRPVLARISNQGGTATGTTYTHTLIVMLLKYHLESQTPCSCKIRDYSAA